MLRGAHRMLFKPLRQRLDAQHALRGQRARQLQPYLLVYGELRVMTLEALAVVLLAHPLQRLGCRVGCCVHGS